MKQMEYLIFGSNNTFAMNLSELQVITISPPLISIFTRHCSFQLDTSVYAPSTFGTS